MIDASAGSVVSNPAAVFNTVRARCQLDQNGLKADVRVESDLAPIADVGRAPRHVAEVPKAAVSRCSNMRVQKPGLFDHLICAGEKHRRHFEAERLGGPEINH